MNKNELTGIILSGGNSSRMGSEKGLVSFRGNPLVSYSIKALEPLCGKILLSANTDFEKYKQFNLRIIQDKVSGIGPMGGLISCLEQSQTHHNLVLSCDAPFITSQFFEYLLDRIENFQAVVPIRSNGKFEPLCAYYNTNVISKIEEAVSLGDYKMFNFLQKIRLQTVLIDQRLPFFHDRLFENINSSAQLEE